MKRPMGFMVSDPIQWTGKIKSFGIRLAAAMLIFGVIWGVSAIGGSPGRAVQNGISYLLTKNYDLLKGKEGLEMAFQRAENLWFPDDHRGGVSELEVSMQGKQQELPVSGRLVREFGWQKDSSGWPYYSEGIELSVAQGTPVRAVFPGKVVRVESSKKVGQVILIEHGQDSSALYGRLGEIRVKADQEVVKGQVIGVVEDTLFHFQLREGEELVDPLLWVKD